jgi:LysR family glycine cleavage system transcriptional activator
MPPVSALRALDAAAAELSFTKAARRLNVTPSAISHQIRTLENAWGLTLFERRGQRLAATPGGRKLATITHEFFERIRDALDGFQPVAPHEPLRIDALQSFAVKWLVPRLGHFQDKHPEVNVWISTHGRLVDFAEHEVDLAIRLGRGSFSGYSELLLREDVFPVCTPEFLARMGRPRTPRSLLAYPLLQRLGDPDRTNWEEWFEAAGVRGARPREGPRFPDTNLALTAALDGLGIALARTAHVVDDLLSRRLVRLFDVHCPANVAYYLVCPEGHQDRAKIAAFREWILAEVAETERIASSFPKGEGAAKPRPSSRASKAARAIGARR